MTVTDDTLPMTLDQFGELLVRLQTAPLELCLPIIEELPSPGGILVIPKLPERFFEHVGFAQAFIGFEQERQRASSVQIEIGFMRQKCIALPFDEALILAGDPCVFLTPDLVEGIRQVFQDVELVEDDFGLGSVARERVSERFPHVHDCQAQGTVPLGPHSVEEAIHIFFATAKLLAHPDWPLLVKVGDYDGVLMTFLDRYFINADSPQTFRRNMLGPEIPHVADIHAPDLVPTEPMKFGGLLDGHCPAEPADDLLEALGKTPRFGQPSQGFLLHTNAFPAVHSAILEFQVNPDAPGIDVAHLMCPAVVETAGGCTA